MENKELGFDGFNEMLIKCYADNVKEYYRKVYNNYLEFLGGNAAQDDMTIVIILNPKNQEV